MRMRARFWWVSVRAAMGVLAMAVAVVAGPAGPALGLAVGERVADDRVGVQVTGTGVATTYAGLPGRWFVADVTLIGLGDIQFNAILDWKLVTASGTELQPFPGNEASVPGGRLEPGASAIIRLGFDVADDVGVGVLVYQPFMDTDPLGRWSVNVESPAPNAIDSAADGAADSAIDFSAPGALDTSIASSGSEQVDSFQARYDVQADGSILVTETIAYDFGVLDRHGIFRDLALFQPLDDDRERRYPITGIEVEATEGTPAQFELLRDGDFRRIKIGDPDVTITGLHTYTLRYRLGAALNPQPAGPELYFNVTGTWPVAMQAVSIEVSAPGGIARLACFAGPTGSTTACSGAERIDGMARFGEGELFAGDQLTIVVGLPEGSVTVPPWELGEAPRDLADAVEPSPGNIGGAAGVGVLGIAGIAAVLWRKGRDFVAGGSAVDAVMSPDDLPARRLPLLRRVPTPVQFTPPDNIRPGLLGTLYDERADAVDISATIVDLACRGFLRIEEIPDPGLFGKGDHRLVRLTDNDGSLLAYEASLLGALFATGNEVLLSDLKNTFAAKLERVRTALYAETVQRRWFERSPERVRTIWRLIGTGILTVGGLAMFASLTARRWVWPAGVLVIIGVVFLAMSGRMPRRTARGTATMRLVEGFRTFIDESEVHRAKFDERRNLFTEYLPYAIVFGCVDKWAKTFSGLDGQVPTTPWYVGSGSFNSRHFSRSINGFASTAGSTMSSTPGGSGGSGFSGGSSGGGGGGGGGGSW